MRNGKSRRDNRGASLILVIGCIALLSVVGSMLLVITNNNREMKALEERMQRTFYEADSNSDEMVSALEGIAETAIKDAFSDMMVEYSLMANKADRDARFAEYFKEVLATKIEASGAATTIMRDALGLDATENPEVKVSFGEFEYGTASAGKTGDIRIKDAKFVYEADGAETTITTDIVIKAAVPDVEAGFNAGQALCDFSDFAVITAGDVEFTGSNTQQLNVTGNLYAKGNLNIKQSGRVMTINNADKILVGKTITVDDHAVLNVTRSNGELLNPGEGVWTEGLTVGDGAKVDAKANFYVSDDLTLSGDNTSVKITGDEYVGYSGGSQSSTDHSGDSSAITINSSKNITLDLSGVSSLVLSGSSYIHDTTWNNESENSSTGALGVLQGESVAYKNMQALYLVPGECLPDGHNPMLKSEYETYSDGTNIVMPLKSEITNSGLNLNDYVVSTQKYTARYVRLGDGSTTYVYLYLNFQSPEKAQEYFEAYLATPDGDAIKAQIARLENSTIKLATNNYTLASRFTYDYTEGTPTFQSPTATEVVVRSTQTTMTKKRKNSLFSTFRVGTATTVVSDILTEKIIDVSKIETTTGLEEVAGSAVVVDGTEYKMWICNGDFTWTNEEASTMNGILLIKGKFINEESTGRTVNGLVIATDGVKINSAMNFNANEEAVEALLELPSVAKYFKGFSGVDGAGGGGSGSYLSSDSVDISFENWQKN